MISKSRRFHGYGSLNYVYRNGLTTRGPLFSIRNVPNPKRENYRLAVVVSRKISKSAVTRNRIRRRLYEAARGLEPGIGAQDIVLTVFDDKLTEIDYSIIVKEMRKLLKKAGVLKA